MARYNNFSNFDVFIITKELDKIISGGTIVNVYQIEDLLIFKINTKQEGKKNLIIKNDSRLNLTEYDYPIPKYPSQYITSLRKFLKNRKILTVFQHNFDRIIVLELLNYDGGSWKFIIELFNKGNYLILDENNLIKVARKYSKYKDRNILANQEYKFPETRGNNFLTINQEEFNQLIHSFEEEIVRILARKINISGLYSEEICLRANIDKTTIGTHLTNDELKSLFKELKYLRNQLLFGEFNPYIIKDMDENEIGVIPFDLDSFKDYKKIFYDSFNEAVDAYYSKIDSNVLIAPPDNSIKQKIKSQEKILNNQLEYLNELKKKKKKYYDYGDFIYANFNSLQKLFDVILNARNKGYNWIEINEKLKNAKKEKYDGLKFFNRIVPATQQLIIMIENDEVYLDLNESLGENANIIYSKGKKADKKIKGTIPAIEKTTEKIKELELEKETIEEKVDFLLKKPKKKWYEKFRWFKSSDGFLIIGGRDATSNEVLFKKHLNPNDLVFHTVLPGSPLMVIKNPENKNIPDNTIKETAIFVASYSRAWKEVWNVVDVFYVFPSQISKSPPSGEFLPKGSFMITGKKNFIKDSQTQLAVGLELIEMKPDSNQKSKIFYPKAICGPIDALKSQIEHYLVIQPSKKGFSKGKVAKEIKSYYLKNSDKHFRKWIKLMSEEDIILILPAGNSIIKY